MLKVIIGDVATNDFNEATDKSKGLKEMGIRARGAWNLGQSVGDKVDEDLRQGENLETVKGEGFSIEGKDQDMGEADMVGEDKGEEDKVEEKNKGCSSSARQNNSSTWIQFKLV